MQLFTNSKCFAAKSPLTHEKSNLKKKLVFSNYYMGFPGCSVINNPRANAGDAGSNP